MELVTLEAPDGRRFKTDSKSEMNLLIGTYGYRRVSEQTSRRSKPAPAPKRAPEPPPPTPDGDEE